MFEEEAEEYLKKDGTKAEQILDMLNEISPLKITLKQVPFVLAMIQQAFKDGAEFGYNKANEWHYVKDGDLPKVGEKVLSEKDDLVIYKGDGFNWVEYSPNADNIKLRKWEEPRAWKEITLPKEIEQND